jgi:hypothetical protein
VGGVWLRRFLRIRHSKHPVAPGTHSPHPLQVTIMSAVISRFEFHIEDVSYPEVLDKKLTSMSLRHGSRFDEPMHTVLRYAHYAHRMQQEYGNLSGLILGGEVKNFTQAVSDLFTSFRFDRQDILSILISVFRFYDDKGLSARSLENNFAMWMKYWPFMKDIAMPAYFCMHHLSVLAARTPLRVHVAQPHTGRGAWQTHGLTDSELDTAYNKLLALSA